MLRQHPTKTLVLCLVVLVACGGGQPGSLPDAVSETSGSSTSTMTTATGQVTTTTAKPQLTTDSLPATTVTSAQNGGATTTTEPSTSTTSQSGGFIQVPESVLNLVIEDAANRQSIGVVGVTVLSGQPVDWSDGSLGCPEPGKSYTQVLTPGYLVLVDAGGVTLEYHVNQMGGFKQCSGGVYYPPSGY